MVSQVGSCHSYFPPFLLQISGKDALEKTTLKSLGLTGGSAIIRLGGASFGFFIFPFHSGGEFFFFVSNKKEKKNPQKKVQKDKHRGTQ